MAQLDAVIKQRVKVAVVAVSRFGRVVRAYLFGSQMEGTADRWSDIDLAVFVEGVKSWDMHHRARIAAQVQKTAGDDVEIHFLPAKALQERDDASLAA
jgi:predicted nucleotidyltransferase